MRLIDADVMLEELKDKNVVIAQQNIADWIDEQPTVDAVRHGKWIDDLDENGRLKNAWRKCSFCGGLNYSKKPPYCPNCGAKMG